MHIYKCILKNPVDLKVFETFFFCIIYFGDIKILSIAFPVCTYFEDIHAITLIKSLQCQVLYISRKHKRLQLDCECS